MRTKRFFRVTALMTALTVGAGSLAAAPAGAECECTAEIPDWNFPAEASDHLTEIQSTAARLSRETDSLEAFSRMAVSWESHANQLSAARERINDIGKRLERLQAIRHVTAPWQQQAIDSIVPVAAGLAARTEAAIQHLNENRLHLWAPAYIDHLKTITEQADRMKEHVDLHLDLASAQQETDDLRKKLESIGS